MAARADVIGQLGPPDGDLLVARHVRWLPVEPPRRPGPCGQRVLTFTVAGRGVYNCAGAELIARRGDLVIVHDDSPTTHACPAGEPWERSAIRFDPPGLWMTPSAFERIGPGLHRAHVALESTRQCVQDAFARIIVEVRRRKAARALDALPQTVAQLAAGLTDEPRRRLLMTMLEEIFLLAIQDPDDRATVDPRIAIVLEAMGSDPAAPYTFESLAQMATLSPSRFAHMFSEQVGMSPVRTLQLIRLQHAARLLQCTDDPIGTVARVCGFSSISYFSSTFSRQHGTSPREYRAKSRS